jgi:hypothetical protein
VPPISRRERPPSLSSRSNVFPNLDTSGVLPVSYLGITRLRHTGSSAGDPLAQPKADLAKLTADAAGARTTVAADVTNGDVAQLKHDAKAGLTTLKADWKLLLVDVTTARKAGGDKTELRSLLRAARAQVKGFRSAVRSSLARASKTAKRNTGSNRSAHSSSSRGSDENEVGG